MKGVFFPFNITTLWYSVINNQIISLISDKKNNWGRLCDGVNKHKAGCNVAQSTKD